MFQVDKALKVLAEKEKFQIDPDFEGDQFADAILNIKELVLLAQSGQMATEEAIRQIERIQRVVEGFTTTSVGLDASVLREQKLDALEEVRIAILKLGRLTGGKNFNKEIQMFHASKSLKVLAGHDTQKFQDVGDIRIVLQDIQGKIREAIRTLEGEDKPSPMHEKLAAKAVASFSEMIEIAEDLARFSARDIGELGEEVIHLVEAGDEALFQLTQFLELTGEITELSQTMKDIVILTEQAQDLSSLINRSLGGEGFFESESGLEFQKRRAIKRFMRICRKKLEAKNGQKI